MRNVAGVALSTSALFLLLVAVLLNSPALFYMSSALIATIAASRLQAWLSVRGLRFERETVPAATIGDEVIVSIIAWSDRRMKRPLIIVEDELPQRLATGARTPSLPIAPSFDQPIATRYSFLPLCRGRFRWNALIVHGTDALGLVTTSKRYGTQSTELIVYPAPIPVSLEISPATGWGTSEMEAGKHRGSGIEPRGIREYVEGDPMRYVHWPSSARTGALMVKDFEAGSGLSATFVIQQTRGTEIGEGSATTLEAMCGHVAFVAEQLVRLGARVHIAGDIAPPDASGSTESKLTQIYETLTYVSSDKVESLAHAVLAAAGDMAEGSAIYILIAVQDLALPDVLAKLPNVQKLCLVYDADSYLPRGSKKKISSAAQPVYLEQLRNSGASVELMPRVEGVA